MQKDMLKNGPLSIEFQANGVFSSYKDGILDDEGMPTGPQGLEQLAASIAEQSAGAIGDQPTSDALIDTLTQALADQSMLQLETDRHKKHKM
jgi:hypothetical protein